MERVCFILEVRPGYEDEYKRRHDEIWPELVEDIRASGFKNNSIWRYGLLLIGYFETEDLETSIKAMEKSAISSKWGDYMAPIMKIETDPATGFYYRLPCMCELD